MKFEWTLTFAVAPTTHGMSLTTTIDKEEGTSAGSTTPTSTEETVTVINTTRSTQTQPKDGNNISHFNSPIFFNKINFKELEEGTPATSPQSKSSSGGTPRTPHHPEMGRGTPRRGVD